MDETDAREMRCEFEQDGGAYVLGALSPAERAAYERHLAICPVCRETTAELAVLPHLLGRLGSARFPGRPLSAVPPSTVPPSTLPPSTLPPSDLPPSGVAPPAGPHSGVAPPAGPPSAVPPSAGKRWLARGGPGRDRLGGRSLGRPIDGSRDPRAANAVDGEDDQGDPD